MIWDDSIIQEVAERRAVFVLGAGASMACETPDGRRPPSWGDLLDLLNGAVANYSERTYANSLISSGRLLEAAEVIRMNISAPEFTRIIRENLRNPDYQPSGIHKAIIEIDPKIVITTNYDEIYEKLFRNLAGNGYTVVKPNEQENIISNLRSGDRCILKLHGCVTQTQDIVLNKTSYFNNRRKFPKFYNTIDAIFLINTIIFIGTSLDDPDLQLVLENAQIAAPIASVKLV